MNLSSLTSLLAAPPDPGQVNTLRDLQKPENAHLNIAMRFRLDYRAWMRVQVCQCLTN